MSDFPNAEEFERLKKDVSFHCRFHPTDSWHEVGCPHKEWSNEELIDALRGQKVMNDILGKKLVMGVKNEEELPLKDNQMRCSKCGKIHEKTECNCCWVHCDCGAKICGRCGSMSIGKMEMSPDDEAQYWCCDECNDCGLQGCAMCI